MAKSKNNKTHKARLERYKKNKKQEQELFKKKMMEHYTKLQQENLANKESHTSTEEVSGPEIDIDGLDIEQDVNIEQDINFDSTIEGVIEKIENDDNNNK